MAQFNCPNCGAPLETRLTATKMVDCDHCETTVLLADDGLTSMGTRGTMTDYPSLIRLHQPFRVGADSFHPVGHARFSYGRGWWDEWWCETGRGYFWVSVDEGDYAVEVPVEIAAPLDVGSFAVGQRVRFNGEDLKITETGSSVCEAIRGELPEPLRVGDTYTYWHLSGQNGRLITIEEEDGEAVATEGHWLDPFKIKIQAA
ncbi:MAG: DUF4178 domain-containing protein [Pseudomonadota bacterium]